MSGSTPVHRGIFVAIDFETADEGRDSACAVALVRVEDGRETARASSLIRPPREAFVFTHIHEITWEDVAGERTFGEVWPTLVPMLEGAGELVAHNAAFDRAVLEACCAAAGLEAPKLPWSCTVEIARRTWPTWENHKLPTACRELGIGLRHHDAESDAAACAAVYLRAQQIVPAQVSLLAAGEGAGAKGKARCSVKGCRAHRVASCAFPVVYLGEIGVADAGLGECGARVCGSHLSATGGLDCCPMHGARMAKPRRPWRWAPGLHDPMGVGKTGMRSDGRRAPVTLLRDGGPVAGYESEQAARRDALYFALSHKMHRRAVWATARKGELPQLFDVARTLNPEGTGAGSVFAPLTSDDDSEITLEDVWPEAGGDR